MQKNTDIAYGYMLISLPSGKRVVIITMWILKILGYVRGGQKVIRDPLCCHYATRNATPQFLSPP